MSPRAKRARSQSPATAMSDSELRPLVEAIAARQLILFAGGGLSQSLGLPDFRTLIRHIAEDMGFDPGALDMSDYPVIAEAYEVKHAQLGALRSWMDMVWHPPGIDIRRSEVHNLIVDLDFPIIYTTNYDRWLERAFAARRKPFHKITNVADLTLNGDGTEIIKFHGDFDDDDSLVLTESSYFRRMVFNTPLDIRLRSDSLARPLLFIGYSLHDLNTRYLLFRLQELWKSSPHADQRPKSYILMTERAEAQEILLRSRGVLPITMYGDEPGRATASFLRALLTEVAMIRGTSPPPRKPRH